VKAPNLIHLNTLEMADQEPTRFPQLKLEELPEESRPLGDHIMKTSSAGLLGPYNVMLRSPVMATKLKALMDYFAFETTLPRKFVEFAILIQARLWTSNVEWFSHVGTAMKAGLSQSVVDDLKANVRPKEMMEDEEVVYDVCMEMCAKKEISEELFMKAKGVLGEQMLVDLTAAAGTYALVAMMLSLNEGGWPAAFAAKMKVEKPFA